jgi:signal transduction histidine kinase
MSTEQRRVPAVDYEHVVITPQLQQRASRYIDPEKENAAFRDLASHLADDPDKLLQKLVEIALNLCAADTVGVSVEEADENGGRIFRWVAMAGALKDLIGGTTPRNFSPCGVCVDQNQPLLMERLDRAYPYFGAAPLPFVEALLLPWEVRGDPVGTLWIVAHNEERKFDREDVRVMRCLATFASGAIRLKETMLEAQRALAAVHMVAAMAHHINNPLQGAMFALHHAKSQAGLDPTVREMILLAEHELNRVAALSAELLQRVDNPQVKT